MTRRGREAVAMDEPPLAGRTILVTGGAHRVGGAISRHLGLCGARVLVHYSRSAREAAALAAELPAGGAAGAAGPGGPGARRRAVAGWAAGGGRRERGCPPAPP